MDRETTLLSQFISKFADPYFRPWSYARTGIEANKIRYRIKNMHYLHEISQRECYIVLSPD
jgi:hypothetical protein